ncbi:MAG: metallophosphoesterase [Polyangiaceae bacterium]
MNGRVLVTASLCFGLLLGGMASAGVTSCSGASGGEIRGAPGSESGADPTLSTRGVVYHGGAVVRGAVGPDGGAVSRLYFAVVGDTRPVAMDDTAGYPSAVVSKIYATMDAVVPRPTFALSTGDYQYTSPSGDQGPAQVDLYLAARAGYRGVLFPAMGNHECTGATGSNCGAGNADGTPGAYRAYLTKLLAPIGKTSPYYEVDVDSIDGSWTSKLVFIAGNAWTNDEENWFDRAMSRPTTYTFVVRHEGSNATAAPGVVPSERILALHPYTLAICGHTHTYDHPSRREVIVGNGGAPLSSSKGYGFAVVSQQPGGAIAVDMIDYASGLADPRFRFELNPDGSLAR